MPCGHGAIDTRLQVSQPPQRADNPMADLLDHVSCSAGADIGDVGIAGWIALEKARLEALVGTIEIDPFRKSSL